MYIYIHIYMYIYKHLVSLALLNRLHCGHKDLGRVHCSEQARACFGTATTCNNTLLLLALNRRFNLACLDIRPHVLAPFNKRQPAVG